jgi:hypothetical protein
MVTFNPGIIRSYCWSKALAYLLFFGGSFFLHGTISAQKATLFPQSPKVTDTLFHAQLPQQSDSYNQGLRLALLSMQGLANRKKASVFLSGRKEDSLLIGYYRQKGYFKTKIMITPWDLLKHFRNVPKGLVIIDTLPGKDYSVNIATNIAGVEDLLITTPNHIAAFKKLGLEVKRDLRRIPEMKDANTAYRWVHKICWPQQRHDVLANVYYNYQFDFNRDYLIEFKIPTIWFAGKLNNDYSEELDNHFRSILAETPVNIPILGFWPVEGKQEDKKNKGYRMVSTGKKSISSNSSDETYSDFALDGKQSTRWISDKADTTKWITIDLGSDYLLEKILIQWGSAGPYRLSFSAEGDQFVEAGSFKATSNSLSEELIRPDKPYRFVKISSRSFLSIVEIGLMVKDTGTHQETVQLGLGEYTGVKMAGEYGKFTVVSDWAGNYSYHSGIPVRTVFAQTKVREKNARNYDPKKKYVAITMIESGDAPAYYQYAFPTFQWQDSSRGSIAYNYSITPLMQYLMPGMVEYLYETATDNDYFFSSISGIGYMYPLEGYGSLTRDPAATLREYYQLTSAEMKKMDMDMLGLYSHPRKPWSGEDMARLKEQVLPGMSGLKAVWADMGRLNEMNAANANQVIAAGISLHHCLSRWATTPASNEWNPPYNTKYDEAAVNWLANEIRTAGAGGSFLHIMAYSWHYGPRRIKKVAELLQKEGFEFLTLQEFETVYRQSLQAK